MFDFLLTSLYNDTSALQLSQFTTLANSFLLNFAFFPVTPDYFFFPTLFPLTSSQKSLLSFMALSQSYFLFLEVFLSLIFQSNLQNCVSHFLKIQPYPSFPQRTAYFSHIQVKNMNQIGPNGCHLCFIMQPQSLAIQAPAISTCFVNSPRYSVPGYQPSPKSPKVSLICIWPSQHGPAALGAGQIQQYFGIFGSISQSIYFCQIRKYCRKPRYKLKKSSLCFCGI